MTAPARQYVSAARRAMLAKVHLAAKEIGLSDDDRRDVLERLTGKRSSADCTDAQLDQVLSHFKRQGWKPKAAGAPARAAPAVRRAQATHPVALKARALWISLWQLGVVRRREESALEAFAARQLGVDRLQWADQGQGYRLIEALKAMAERHGWPQTPIRAKDQTEVHALKCALIEAQWKRLSSVGATRFSETSACRSYLQRLGLIPGVGALQWAPEAALDAAIAHLGERIRKSSLVGADAP